jgi:hypothetical protein
MTNEWEILREGKCITWFYFPGYWQKQVDDLKKEIEARKK